MNNQNQTYDQIQQIREQLSKVTTQHWLHYNFLTWRWWLLVIVFTLLPYFIWYKIVDKKRIGELLLYGFFTGICCVTLDDMGTAGVWWIYPMKLLPLVPPLFPADLVLVPVFLMIVYQIAHSWRSFIIGNVIMGLLMAYVGEPLFNKLGYYELKSWKFEYSFLFYIGVSTLGRWVVMAIKNKGET